MTLKDLLVKIGFEVDKDPLEKAEKHLESIKHTLELLAAAEVVKGLFELGEKFGKFAEELHVAAESAGLTVEAFQRLTYAAGKSAVTSEEMAGAMARLGRQLYQARQGGEEAQKAFQQAGFSGDQIKGFHTAGDAMLALSDRFKSIQDPIQKQALAMQLMGRGSVNMVAFLSQGSGAIKGMGVEAQKLGIVLGHDQVEALVKVEHSMYTLFSVFRAVSATLASYLAPSIEHAINDFLKFYEVNKKLIDSNLRAWVYDITFALGFVYQAVKYVVQGFFDFAKSHEVLVRRVSEFLVGLGLLAGVIFIVSKAIGLLKAGFELLIAPLKIVVGLFEYLMTPMGLILLAIGLMTVAVHDLWEVAHGRPGWVQQFIDFLEIGQQVADVFDAIFTIIEDIMDLNFGKLVGDAVDDFKSLTGFASKVGGKIGDFIGLNNSQTSTVNAGDQSASNSYQVNAPITVNVPEGTDPKSVGKSVQQGISDHLDTVYRRTQQAFTPAVHY